MDVFSGLTLLGTTNFNPTDDAVTFFGVTDALGFDRVEITDLTGTIDNEYFGAFQVAPVPLPAGLPLLLAGLAGLGVMRRRWGAAPAQ